MLNCVIVGGMINIDVSGQGSCMYGKMCDYVFEFDFVLMGGEWLYSDVFDEVELECCCVWQDCVGKVYCIVWCICDDKVVLIDVKFLKFNCCLIGYDFVYLCEVDGCFNLNSVLCGVEGLFGFVVEVKFNVLLILKFLVLVNVCYVGFMDVLCDVCVLFEYWLLLIEMVDLKVLMFVMKDFVWSSVVEYFLQDDVCLMFGINLIEFSGDDEYDVDVQVCVFVEYLCIDMSVECFGYMLVVGDDVVKCVYVMCKCVVGLFGNVQGEVCL